MKNPALNKLTKLIKNKYGWDCTPQWERSLRFWSWNLNWTWNKKIDSSGSWVAKAWLLLHVYTQQKPRKKLYRNKERSALECNNYKKSRPRSFQKQKGWRSFHRARSHKMFVQIKLRHNFEASFKKFDRRLITKRRGRNQNPKTFKNKQHSITILDPKNYRFPSLSLAILWQKNFCWQNLPKFFGRVRIWNSSRLVWSW